jgi:hypothetical protein
MNADNFLAFLTADILAQRFLLWRILFKQKQAKSADILNSAICAEVML